MRYVDFGRTGLRVSQHALGTGRLGSLKDGSLDRDQARSVLTGYVAAGGNFIDSSDAYQGGQSEEMIGSFLSDQRQDLVIASKYSRTTGRDASPASRGNHRKAMVQSVEASLRRLSTDRIDVYFAHYDDGITPIDEIMRGFEDLVSAGKILYAGSLISQLGGALRRPRLRFCAAGRRWRRWRWNTACCREASSERSSPLPERMD